MKDAKTTKHESFGIIGCSRITGGTRNLFGSSIEHSNTIMLRIKTASVDRHLNTNWYHGDKDLIEIEMSPTQFSEMITSLNVGDGVPCTLRYIEGKRISDPPKISQRVLFEEEFKEKINKLENECSDGVSEVADILLKKGNITVKERKQAWGKVVSIMRIVSDSIPFLQKQFNKAMDKTVNEAKGEVEAFVMNRVTSLGIKGLEKEMLKLSEGEEQSK